MSKMLRHCNFMSSQWFSSVFFLYNGHNVLHSNKFKPKLMFLCTENFQKPENMVQIVVSVFIHPINITINVWDFLLSSPVSLSLLLSSPIFHLPFKYKSTASDRASLFSSAIVGKAQSTRFGASASLKSFS